MNQEISIKWKGGYFEYYKALVNHLADIGFSLETEYERGHASITGHREIPEPAAGMPKVKIDREPDKPKKGDQS